MAKKLRCSGCGILFSFLIGNTCGMCRKKKKKAKREAGKRGQK